MSAHKLSHKFLFSAMFRVNIYQSYQCCFTNGH